MLLFVKLFPLAPAIIISSAVNNPTGYVNAPFPFVLDTVNLSVSFGQAILGELPVLFTTGTFIVLYQLLLLIKTYISS